MDRESGRSRGFGFVTFASSEEASSAIQAMDGQVASIPFVDCLEKLVNGHAFHFFTCFEWYMFAITG